MKLVSIVFSFRNEEGNIEELVKRVAQNLVKIKDWEYELIFVNDGSQDNTSIVLDEFLTTVI